MVTSRKVVSALSSRAGVTSRLITVSIFFVWSLFVLTVSVHKILSFYLSPPALNSSLYNLSRFWRDRFQLATLIFFFFSLLTGWVRGADAYRRVYTFLCGSRRVNIRSGVLLFIPKSPQVPSVLTFFPPYTEISKFFKQRNVFLRVLVTLLTSSQSFKGK